MDVVVVLDLTSASPSVRRFLHSAPRPSHHGLVLPSALSRCYLASLLPRLAPALTLYYHRHLVRHGSTAPLLDINERFPLLPRLAFNSHNSSHDATPPFSHHFSLPFLFAWPVPFVSTCPIIDSASTVPCLPHSSLGYFLASRIASSRSQSKQIQKIRLLIDTSELLLFEALTAKNPEFALERAFWDVVQPGGEWDEDDEDEDGSDDGEDQDEDDGNEDGGRRRQVRTTGTWTMEEFGESFSVSSHSDTCTSSRWLLCHGSPLHRGHLSHPT